MRLPLITDIQRYSIHDGTGIRTTVFFKGCPLFCRWCHNPETQRFQAEILTYSERCVGCGACVKACPERAVRLVTKGVEPSAGCDREISSKSEKEKYIEVLPLCDREMSRMKEEAPTEVAGKEANSQSKNGGLLQSNPGQMADEVRIARTDGSLCTACGTCVDWCVKNAREICGKTWELSELEKELLKDRAFYETSGGGVTLSGGEVLAQDMDYIEALLSRLHRRGIRVNIDTCGDVPYEAIARVLSYTDVFLYDFKIADEERHRAYTGRSNVRILENLERLSEAGANIWIRIPVIGTVNDDSASIAAIGDWLKEHKIQIRQVNLLPYHNTGSSKYPRVGRTYEGSAFTTPDPKRMEEMRQVMERFGFAPVLIGDDGQLIRLLINEVLRKMAKFLFRFIRVRGNKGRTG